MRSLLLASAALVAFAGAASADVAINLTGTIAQSCSVASGGAQESSSFNINLTETRLFQETDTLSVRCNFDGQATVKLTSTNSGKLTSQFGDFVTYNVSTPFTTRAGVSLAAPVSYSVPSNTNQIVNVKVNEAATRAGTYTDTITATVSP